MQESLQDRSLSRREREKLARRSEMVAAARKVFARRGFAQATLDDVAELSEFGKGTIYNYFPNKEALFESLLQEDCRRFIQIFRDCLEDGSSLHLRIRKVVRESLRFMLTNPESMLLMLRESHQLRESNPVIRLYPELSRLLAEVLREGRSSGSVRTDLPTEEMSILLMNMVTGQFMSRLHRSFHSWCNAGTPVPEPKSQNGDLDEFETLNRLMKEGELEKGIDESASLVCSIFFDGIKPESGKAATGS